MNNEREELVDEMQQAGYYADIDASWAECGVIVRHALDALVARPDLVLAVLVEAGVARTGWTVPWGVVWDDDGDPLPPGLPRVFAVRSRGSEVTDDE